jgi:hypothetical protein
MSNDQASESGAIVRVEAKDIVLLIERTIGNVREDTKESPYIKEALKVLTVGGYRSAIGCFWNAVVDDLRNKIIHRSLEMFNKSMTLGRTISNYDDFQNYINDDQLIEGAYKIGVIGWEASKILKHAKETRHIFDGHPKSSDPSIIKVLGMMEDCVKYVLADPYPPQIIDVSEYLTQMASATFDRNEIGIETAVTELPEIYQKELINRLMTEYIDPNGSTVLRSNIEFVTPFLWRVLSPDVKRQVVRRVDSEISAGNLDKISQAFSFVKVVSGAQYLSATARKYLLKPLIEQLKINLDNFGKENILVRDLEPYAAYIPPDLLDDYVKTLVMTYVGHIGGSPQFRRTDFYANDAAVRIPKMFEAFDDKAGLAFVKAIRGNSTLRSRIASPTKLNRLKALGNIVLERTSATFSERAFLEALVDENKIEAFYKTL